MGFWLQDLNRIQVIIRVGNGGALTDIEIYEDHYIDIYVYTCIYIYIYIYTIYIYRIQI